MKRAHLTPLLLVSVLVSGCSPSPWVDPPAFPPARDTATPRVVDPIMPAGEAAGREDRAARHAVARLHAFTNLGPRERARIEHAEVLLAQQRHAEARRLAEELAQDFSRAFVPYRIRAGDTLARIAGREDVFANARLWPLLRDANPDLPGDKVPLTEGRVIHVPMHPTVTQISRALERSRNSAGTR